MFRLLADENFDNDIVRGVLRRTPHVDFLRVQDVGLAGADDPEILAWAAHEDRVLLTHDAETITKFAYERMAAGLPIAGVFEIRQSVPIGVAIEEILLIIEYSEQQEWAGNVHFLPLKH
jgi:hypothetical protein